MKKHLIGILTALSLFTASPASAVQPYTMEILTLAMGTSSYVMDMALESFFKEINGPVKMQIKQTPGATFIVRYNLENKEKMRSGEMPQTTSFTLTPILNAINNGLTPFEKTQDPDQRILFVVGGNITNMVTYDEDIQNIGDLVGKKVGGPEKARITIILPYKPILDKHYGGFEKVNWQYIGFANSKDALLNGSISAHVGSYNCKLEVAEDGTLFTQVAMPDPSTMEAISANKPWHSVNIDPKLLDNLYNPKTDYVQFPLLMKAGSIPGQTEDVWTIAAASLYNCDKDLPDDVVEEIVYQVFSKKERLGDFYEGFKLMGDSPYLNTIPVENYHPGVFKAMKRLGLPLPEGVVVE